ncbi:MAG: alcohol dehydrogenase catalytic domain-containing protein, partial [Geminicoccaceae bacterium]
APGEVLIEVSACGMNNTDVWVRQGAYGTEEDPAALSTWRRQGNTLTFPRIQGADTVGTIVAVGDGVSASRINERVMVDFSIYNRDDDSLADIDYIGHGRDGGYAEYMTAPVENAHVVHTGMSDVELATFCCAYLTVRDIGAEAVIVRGAGDLVAQVGDATAGKPIDVVADLVAGPLFNDLLRVLRPEGRYTTAGAIAGPVVQLDLRTVYLKHLQLHGSSQGTRGAFRRLLGYIEHGKIRALVGGVYKLSDFHRAQTDFMGKTFVGKLIVVPDAKWDSVARNSR